MIDLKREICKPVLKLDFTAHGTIEFLYKNLDSAAQSTHRGRVEIGEVYLPSQLERTQQLCTLW
jgi:hypothetical protein